MVDDVQFIAGKKARRRSSFTRSTRWWKWASRSSFPATARPSTWTSSRSRIASRLQCGLVVDLHPTDYELRLGVLQHKAERMRARLSAGPDRRWRAGIHRRTASHQCPRARRRADPAFCLADLVRARDHDRSGAGLPRRHPQAHRTQGDGGGDHQATCEYYNIRLRHDRNQASSARSPGRGRSPCICPRSLTTRSLPDIGRKFGGRDHTTILLWRAQDRGIDPPTARSPRMPKCCAACWRPELARRTALGH
jgi:chromosomal replication initiator protein